RFRRVLLALAVVLAAGFFLATRGYWVAADPGVDENAYLVAGKLLAQTGSPGFVPPDPYSLVGKMWIGTREGRFYPKYPLGQPRQLPLLHHLGDAPPAALVADGEAPPRRPRRAPPRLFGDHPLYRGAPPAAGRAGRALPVPSGPPGAGRRGRSRRGLARAGG